MNFVISPILKLVAAATIALSVLAYINVLRSDNEALQVSVERYKHDAEHNAQVAKNNADLFLKQEAEYQSLFEQYTALNKEVKKIDDKQQIKEKEVVRYVERLPEGFEKQCLNMPVPASIGRVQNN